MKLGPGVLSSNILKLSATAVATPLTSLFNYCILTSTLPSDWKMSNVTPIHKRVDVTDRNNYRPVSVLSTISKLFEKAIFNQLYAFLYTIILTKLVGFPQGKFLRYSPDQTNRQLERRMQRKERIGCICYRSVQGFLLHVPLLRSYLYKYKQRWHATVRAQNDHLFVVAFRREVSLALYCLTSLWKIWTKLFLSLPSKQTIYDSMYDKQVLVLLQYTLNQGRERQLSS